MVKPKSPGVNKAPTTPASHGFLSMPLKSILLYMQLNRYAQSPVPNQNPSTVQHPLPVKHPVYVQSSDPEDMMYYEIKDYHPFDAISKIQMKTFDGVFSLECNKQAITSKDVRSIIHKRSPYPVYTPIEQNSQEVESVTYAAPIGPLPFLASTVPLPVDSRARAFLEDCARY